MTKKKKYVSPMIATEVEPMVFGAACGPGNNASATCSLGTSTPSGKCSTGGNAFLGCSVGTAIGYSSCDGGSKPAWY